MKLHLFSAKRKPVVFLVILAVFAYPLTPALAKSPVKFKNFIGTIDFVSEDSATFTLDGTASHLGRYHCYGEVDFVPGTQEGSMLGDGVAVFEVANGDLLVGVVNWIVDAGGGDMLTSHMHFSWRDAITLADGTIVASTGRFTDNRPPGLVVIAIIAILIGLLLPAVQ